MQLEAIHNAFLSLPETRTLLFNLNRRLNNQLEFLMNQATLAIMSDTQIRILAAEAKSTKEIINYVSKDPKCIVRS